MPSDLGPTPVAVMGGGALVAQDEFERTAESVGRARLHIEDVLTDHGVLDRDVVDAAVLLVSELGTDALHHGRGPTFAVAVTLSRRHVQVTVHTAATTERASGSPGSGAAPDIAPHSRTIVDMMADQWDVRQTSRERTAWFRLDR